MSLFDRYRDIQRPETDGLHDIDGVWVCPVCNKTAEEPKYDNDEGMVVNLCDEHDDQKIFIGRGRA